MPKRFDKISLFKARSRKHGEATESIYIAESDELKASYAAEHSAIVAAERRARYPRHGQTAIVKKLTINECKASDEASAMPRALALKCYDNYSTPAEAASVFRMAEHAAAIYRDWGYFASAFTNNSKVFLAMEWISDTCLMDYLNEATKKITKPDPVKMILVFKQLIDQATRFHKRFNKGIGDIKLENVLAKIKDGVVDELAIIDIEGALGSSTTVTLGYLARRDLETYIDCANSGRPYKATPYSDLRTLSIVFAVFMCYSLSNYFEAERTELSFAPGRYGFDISRHTAAGTRYVDEVNVIFECLRSGQNPFAELPEPVFSMMLLHDIESLKNDIASSMEALEPVSGISKKAELITNTGTIALRTSLANLDLALNTLKELSEDPDNVETSLIPALANLYRQYNLICPRSSVEPLNKRFFFAEQISQADDMHLIEQFKLTSREDYLELLKHESSDVISLHLRKLVAAYQERLDEVSAPIKRPGT